MIIRFLVIFLSLHHYPLLMSRSDSPPGQTWPSQCPPGWVWACPSGPALAACPSAVCLHWPGSSCQGDVVSVRDVCSYSTVQCVCCYQYSTIQYVCCYQYSTVRVLLPVQHGQAGDEDQSDRQHRDTEGTHVGLARAAARYLSQEISTTDIPTCPQGHDDILHHLRLVPLWLWKKGIPL